MKMTGFRSSVFGTVARESFETAAKLVKEGKYEEALAVNLLPSDRKLIQARINVASANRTDTKEKC